jgi:hypothetical protein
VPKLVRLTTEKGVQAISGKFDVSQPSWQNEIKIANLYSIANWSGSL